MQVLARVRPKAETAWPKRDEAGIRRAKACTIAALRDVRPNVRAKLPAEAGTVSPD